MDQTRDLRFDDSNVAAAVAFFSNVDPRFELDESGRIVFVFPATHEVVSALSDFQSGIPAPLLDFVNTLRRLRSEMYRRRRCAQ